MVGVVTPARLAKSGADMAFGPKLAGFLRLAMKVEARRIDWRWAVLGVLGAVAVVFLQLVIDACVPGLTFLQRASVFTVCVVLMVFGLREFVRRRSGPSFAATAVSMGVCGSCGYTLEELPTEGDGCVVCPECGAAWKRFRITRPMFGPKKDSLPRPSALMRMLRRVPGEEHLVGVDARGAYFRVLDKRLRLLPAEKRAAFGLARFFSRRSALCRIGLGWRWSLATVPILISVALAMMSVDLSSTSRGGDAAIENFLLQAFSIAFALFAVGVIRGHSFAPPGARGRRAALLGFCNACGRELSDTTPDPDGCTVCEGCGAAWNRGGHAT